MPGVSHCQTLPCHCHMPLSRLQDTPHATRVRCSNNAAGAAPGAPCTPSTVRYARTQYHLLACEVGRAVAPRGRAGSVRPAHRVMSRTWLNELCGRQMMARWKPRRVSFPTRGGSKFSDENCVRRSLYMSNIQYMYCTVRIPAITQLQYSTVPCCIR